MNPGNFDRVWSTFNCLEFCKMDTITGYRESNWIYKRIVSNGKSLYIHKDIYTDIKHVYLYVIYMLPIPKLSIVCFLWTWPIKRSKSPFSFCAQFVDFLLQNSTLIIYLLSWPILPSPLRPHYVKKKKTLRYSCAIFSLFLTEASSKPA